MSDYSVEPIETLYQWNTVGACCCSMPSCPVPTMDCESVSATVASTGYRDVADTTWIRYKESVTTYTLGASGTNNSTTSWGQDYIAEIWSESGTGFNGYSYNRLFAGQVGNDVYCTTWPSTITADCYASGSGRNEYFDYCTYGFPTVKVYGQYGLSTRSLANLGGCSFETTSTTEYFAHDWCYKSDGSSYAPDPLPDPDVTVTPYTSALSALGSLGFYTTPTSETGYFQPSTYAQWVADTLAVIDPALVFTYPLCLGTDCTAGYSVTDEPIVNLAAKVYLTRRRSRFRFQIPAQIVLDTEPPHAELSRWTGTIYQFTYDVMTTPDGWYEGWDGPARSFLEDQTLEWIGPGTGPEDDPSWFTSWVEIEPPSEPGTREIVNIRYACYPNSPYGFKPQTMGTGVDLSEDSPLLGAFTTDRHSIHHTTLL